MGQLGEMHKDRYSLGYTKYFRFEMHEWLNAIGVNDASKFLIQAVPPVIHRDIKSANILLDESMRARVCPFCWF